MLLATNDTKHTLLIGDIPDLSSLYASASHNHAASAITSGVLDNARVNWAAPTNIGTTTPPEITANKSLFIQSATTSPAVSLRLHASVTTAHSGFTVFKSDGTTAVLQFMPFNRWDLNQFSIFIPAGGASSYSVRLHNDALDWSHGTSYGAVSCSLTTGGSTDSPAFSDSIASRRTTYVVRLSDSGLGGPNYFTVAGGSNLGKVLMLSSTSTTNSLVNSLEIYNRTSGTVALGYGVSIDFYGNTSAGTTTDRLMSRRATLWEITTDASRRSRLEDSVYLVSTKTTVLGQGVDGADVGSAQAFFFGRPNADGTWPDATWRIIRNGNNLEIQRRETAAWVVKSTIAA